MKLKQLNWPEFENEAFCNGKIDRTQRVDLKTDLDACLVRYSIFAMIEKGIDRKAVEKDVEKLNEEWELFCNAARRQAGSGPTISDFKLYSKFCERYPSTLTARHEYTFKDDPNRKARGRFNKRNPPPPFESSGNEVSNFHLSTLFHLSLALLRTRSYQS